MKIKTTTIFSRFAESSKLVVRTLALLTSAAPSRMPSRCVNINALLLHLCGFDHEVYAYVLKWLAYPLQHPGARMNRALVFNGGKGSGKNLFFRDVVAALYAGDARHVSDIALYKEFKPWADGSFVLVDGTLTVMAQQRLKQLIVRDVVAIQAEEQPARTVPNRMNFVFLSGEIDFLRPGASDRRFCAIEVPPARDPIFYRAVADEIQNGGVEAFRDYLMNGIDLGMFNEYTPPPVTRTRPQAEAA